MVSSISTKTSSRIIWLTAFGELALYLVLAARGDLHTQMPVFFVLVAGLWGLYIFAAQKLFNGCATNALEASTPQIHQQAGAIIFFAVVFRAIMLPVTPWLSDDIYRYLWDGRVLMHGINPYQWTPNAPELAHLRDAEIFPRVNHPEIGTIYPPLLQGVFAAGQLLGGKILSLKILFTLIDILALILLSKVMRRSRIDQRQVLLYAWNPLPIFEISGSGHADGLVGLFFLLTVLQLGAERFRGAACFIGAGFLMKLTSALILPFLWLRKHFREASIIFAVIIVVGYLPFVGAGAGLFSGLTTFSAKWRFNDSIFSLIFWPIEKILPDSLVVALMFEAGWEVSAKALLSRRIDLTLIITKTIVSCLFIGWMAWLARSFVKEKNSPETWGRLIILLYGGMLLLAPAFQPWYLLWILPLLALWPNRSLLMLSGTVFLSYWILQDYSATGVWQENAWVKWLEFTPVGVMMLYDAYKQKRNALSDRHQTQNKNLKAFRTQK